MPNELADLQRQAELEAYRRRFEEAMIRIEDQEDIEAFKEAKAEIDDEFDEIEGRGEKTAGQQSNATAAGVSQKGDGEEDGVDNEEEAEEAPEGQEEMQADEGVEQEEKAEEDKDSSAPQFEMMALDDGVKGPIPEEEKTPEMIAKEKALAD